ncbi:hypothetical protein BDR22DRAFT_371995 [Usnea florida]
MSASGSNPSISDEPPQKKLRKGTHSCTECRRRKKSCIPRPATPGTCEECFARGAQCRSQEISLGSKRRPREGNSGLQQRVAELETALLSISRKLELRPELGCDVAQAPQQSLSEVRSSTPTASPESNPEADLEHAPVLSLFDNSILSRWPDDSVKGGPQQPNTPLSEGKPIPNSKIDYIRRTLLSLFPPQKIEKSILTASQDIWASWQQAFPQIFSPSLTYDAIQFFEDSKRSGSVQKIAKALLCLCTILQGSVNFNTGHDIANAVDQTKQTIKIIDDMVLSDDELSGTIDGVECIILRANYEGNTGRIRRSWLISRRGVAFAQLLGLHKRPGDPENHSSDSNRRYGIWRALYTTDRFMSLVLGLPYGPSEIYPGAGSDPGSSAKGVQFQCTHDQYILHLTNIAGHIIDRNQQLPSNNMLPLTLKIEGEMIDLKSSMPTQWWETGREIGAVSSQVYSQILPQFWHYLCRTLLHLPYMLKATTSTRFEYNKTATLESAREMIARYRVMRPVQGFGSLTCKVTDFQVFTAAMILVLNLLYHYLGSKSLDHSEAEKDQDLILATTFLLKEASVATDGSVATQAARALETFGNVKAKASVFFKKPAEECTTKLVIPYFGAVMIGPGTSLRDRSAAQKVEATLQPRQLPTPGDQSSDGFTSEPTPLSNPSIAPMIPFDVLPGDQSQGLDMNSDTLPDFDFNLDQDWSWYWDNIDIPSTDMQDMLG